MEVRCAHLPFMRFPFSNQTLNIFPNLSAFYFSGGGGLNFYEEFILSNNTGYYAGGGYLDDAGVIFWCTVTVSGNKVLFPDEYNTGTLFLSFSPSHTLS